MTGMIVLANRCCSTPSALCLNWTSYTQTPRRIQSKSSPALPSYTPSLCSPSLYPLLIRFTLAS